MKETYSITIEHDWPVTRLLGIDLLKNEIKMDKGIWKKIADKHPESLSAAEIHLDEAVLNPDYCGQAHHHFENIELIKRLPGAPLLVAIKVRNKRGFPIKPFVASVYLIESTKVQKRLLEGRLKKAK